MKAGRCFGQAVAVLAVFAVARSFGLLGPAAISVSLLTAALVLIAWSAGATRADLGLARADMRAGLLYGAGAFGVVLLVLVVAAVIPATNGFLHDSRAQIDGGRLLYEIGVPIVLLTAIPEEFAFRGVLLGSGDEHAEDEADQGEHQHHREGDGEGLPGGQLDGHQHRADQGRVPSDEPRVGDAAGQARRCRPGRRSGQLGLDDVDRRGQHDPRPRRRSGAVPGWRLPDAGVRPDQGEERAPCRRR